MGMVHRMVVESCADYFIQMRRRVYQTPRSFLSFLGSYKDLYLTKKEEVDIKSKRVVVGLDKLKKGASDVESMKVQLKEEEIKLKEADLATTKMLSKLEVCIERTWVGANQSDVGRVARNKQQAHHSRPFEDI